MLKETIFAATQQIRKSLGDNDWCVSVFSDNAGVIRFDDAHNVVFKVETHNHPSALEPYGGANTGMGGVIRDSLGTGLGAKPICNTDVFCFAPPDTAGRERAGRACFTRGGSCRASSPAFAITATGWAFPRSTARSISIPATWATRWCSAATWV